MNILKNGISGYLILSLLSASPVFAKKITFNKCGLTLSSGTASEWASITYKNRVKNNFYSKLNREEKIGLLYNSMLAKNKQDVTDELYEKVILKAYRYPQLSKSEKYKLLKRLDLYHHTEAGAHELYAAIYSKKFNSLTKSQRFELLESSIFSGIVESSLYVKYRRILNKNRYSELSPDQRFDLLKAVVMTESDAGVVHKNFEKIFKSNRYSGLTHKQKFELLRMQTITGTEESALHAKLQKIYFDEKTFPSLTPEQRFETLKAHLYSTHPDYSFPHFYQNIIKGDRYAGLSNEKRFELFKIMIATNGTEDMLYQDYKVILKESYQGIGDEKKFEILKIVSLSYSGEPSSRSLIKDVMTNVAKYGGLSVSERYNLYKSVTLSKLDKNEHVMVRDLGLL